MFNFEKVGDNIVTLEQKLKTLEAKPPANEIGYWSRLSDNCNKMSADQLNYVNKNKEVNEAKAEMMEAFSLFLFEKYKEDFAQIETMKPLCDGYIEAIFKACNEYGDVLSRTLEECEELKKKLAKLEEKQNANNSKRA